MSSRSGKGFPRMFAAFFCLLLSLVQRAHGQAACEVCTCTTTGGIVNCTGLGLVEVPMGIPNNTIKLYLGHNLLQSIPDDYLLHLKSLVHLFFNNNNIDQPFQIPESVKLVDARKNKLSDIKHMLKNTVKLHYADFSENNIQVLETDTFGRCSNLSHLTLEENQISKIEPHGLPVGVTWIYLNANNITELGPAQLEGFQGEYMRLEKNNLKVLNPYTFGEKTKLGNVNLQFNQLEELPYGLFLDSANSIGNQGRHIEELRLASNNIRSISPGAFLGVSDFLFISLSNNRLIDLPSDLFAHTNITWLLDLSLNQLKTIPDGLLAGQKLVKYIHLQHNNIKALNRRMFKGLSALKELMIFNNPLTEIESGLFYETKLTNLYMFQTDLETIGNRTFATKHNSIKQVSMYGSLLRQIPNEVWYDLGSECHVAVDNTLMYAPAINRTDLQIELVGDGFSQPIIVPKDVAELFSRSGFTCSKVSQSEGSKWKCEPCPQGHFGAAWINMCLACPQGGFYQIRTGQVADPETCMNCLKCNNGTYISPESHPGVRPADCMVCPSGTNKNTHAGFRACECLDNYYRVDRFGKCSRCPQNGLNCTGEYQHLKAGFWWSWDWGDKKNYQLYKEFVKNIQTEDASYNNKTRKFMGSLPKAYACPRRDSCLNSEEGITATCFVGYNGWLCSRCSKGFYSWFDVCFQCPKWWWFMIEVLGIIVVIILLLILLLWNIHKKRQGRSVLSVVLARGKILLGFYQVMGEIFSALDEITWPKVLTSIGTFLKLLEVNILQLVVSPKCYFPDFDYPNIYIEFLFGLGFVVFILLSAWCFYGFKKCRLKLKQLNNLESSGVLTQTRQKCYLFVVLLLFISYPSLSSVIFELLPSGCDLFYLDENQNQSVMRLRSDYSIVCEEPGHIRFNHAAEGALCYVIGFPVVLFLILWWGKKQKRVQSKYTANNRQEDDPCILHDVVGDSWLYSGRPEDLPYTSLGNYNPAEAQPDVDSLIDQSSDHISWQSFLCENYKSQFWYWEIVELVRKILQTLLVLLFGPEDPFTLFATIIISVGFLVIHAYVKPMKDAAEHRLQMCSLTIIFLNLLASSLLLLPAQDSQSSELRKDILAVILVFLNLSVIGFVAGSLVWTMIKTMWQYGCFGKCMTWVSKIAHRFCCCGPERHNYSRGSRLILDQDYQE